MNSSQNFRLQISKSRKALLLIMFVFNWLCYLYFLSIDIKLGIFFIWAPIGFSALFYYITADKTFELSSEQLKIKYAWNKKNIFLRDILNITFRHSSDYETGNQWGFSIVSVSFDFEYGAPVSLEKCLEFTKTLIQFLRLHKATSWSGIVTSAGDEIVSDQNTIKINMVSIKSMTFKKTGSYSLNDIEILDISNKAYLIDLRPTLLDYYLFKAYFDNQIEMKFEF